MTNELRLCLAVVMCLFLASCKIDYSMVRVAPPTGPVAHLAGGINVQDGGSANVMAVNGVSVNMPTLGREMLIPAGRTTLGLEFWYGLWRARGEYTGEFEDGAYYTADVIPDEENKVMHYRFTKVSPQEFQSFLCATQRKVQYNIRNINPQKAPACDEIAARRTQSVQPQPKPQQSWNGFKSIGK